MRWIKLTGLICCRRAPGISKYFVRAVKSGKIPDFRYDHWTNAVTDTRNWKNRRINRIHDLFDLCLNLSNFCIKLTDQLDGMPELQWLCRKICTDGTSRGFTDFVCFLSAEMSFGCSGKQSRQMLQIGRCDLMSAGKLGKKLIHSFRVKCWYKLFEFREQDVYKAGNRLFQLWSVRNFIKSVSG